METYGFVRLSNIYNYADISFDGILGDSALDEEKKKILKDFFFHLRVKPLRNLRMFRILAARTERGLANYRNPRSVRQERRALRIGRELISKELSVAKTTIEEDWELYKKNEGISSRLQLAILYRVEWKKLIEKNRDFNNLAMNQVLKCVTTRYVRSPKYFKKLILLTIEHIYGEST